MLTKNLVKYTMRKDRVIPFALKLSDAKAKDFASRVIRAFQDCKGLTEVELKEKLGTIPGGKQGVTLLGMFKLQNDKALYEEFDGEATEERWRLIRRAEDLRGQQIWENAEAFFQVLADEEQIDIEQLQDRMYSDLPQFRKCLSAELYDVESLIHRYNVAQLQSLVLHASSLKVNLSKASSSELRFFHRQLKFNRLLCEVIEEGVYEISGPLKASNNKQMYGDRLSNFLPHILNFTVYKVEARVKLKGKMQNLKFDQKSKLQSHYKQHLPHVPEEFALLKSGLGDQYDVQEEGVSISLGQKAHVVPDFSLVKKSGEKVHIELFHRWHNSNLEKLLDIIEESPRENIRFGVSRELSRKEPMKTRLSESPWFRKNGFLFSDFPTPKQVEGVL